MKIFLKDKDLICYSPVHGMEGKLIHEFGQTIAFWKIKKDTVLSEHNHSNTQIIIVTKGILELTIGSETKILTKGMTALVPSDIPHAAIARTDVEITDIFSPIREDFPHHTY